MNKPKRITYHGKRFNIEREEKNGYILKENYKPGDFPWEQRWKVVTIPGSVIPKGSILVYPPEFVEYEEKGGRLVKMLGEKCIWRMAFSHKSFPDNITREEEHSMFISRLVGRER